VGESGSGKTVTALSLLRLVQNAAISGVASFSGLQPSSNMRDLLSIQEHELRGIRGRDIAMIFQEPMTALNPLFTVGEQIAEVLELKLGLARADAVVQAVQLLADTGIPEPERRAKAFPHQLSGGQRQRAMIAMALACQPRLLLADEPTTALDVTLRGQILDLLTGLQQKNGMAVLLITHDLNLVRRFADRVIVMENGHIVEQGRVAGQAWGQQQAHNRALRKVVQVVFQDPFSSLSPRLTVEEIVGEGLLVHASSLSIQERRAHVLRSLDEVGLGESQYPGLLQRYPHEFSGGQRQRLAIARALIVEPRLLVLDEPTSALDVTIQKQVLQLLQRLQRERGLSYLLITHDVDVIRAMAHEVLVMKDGRIVESGAVSAVLDAPSHPYTRTLVRSAG